MIENKKGKGMKKHIRRILIIGSFVALFILLRKLGVFNFMTLETMSLYRTKFLWYVERYYTASAASFIAFYIFISTFALPSPSVLTVIGGYLFGTWYGTLYSNIGGIIGAAGGFLFSRYVIGDSIQKRYSKQLQSFNEHLKEDGQWYLLSLRLMPVFPFTFVNVLAGLTTIPLYTFLWTSALGIIPGAFVYSYAGRQIHNMKTMSDVLSWETCSALLALAFLGILPIFVKRFYRYIRERIRKRRK